MERIVDSAAVEKQAACLVDARVSWLNNKVRVMSRRNTDAIARSVALISRLYLSF